MHVVIPLWVVVHFGTGAGEGAGEATGVGVAVFVGLADVLLAGLAVPPPWEAAEVCKAALTAAVAGAVLSTTLRAFTSESRSVCLVLVSLVSLTVLLDPTRLDGGNVFIKSLIITTKLVITTPIALST